MPGSVSPTVCYLPATNLWQTWRAAQTGNDISQPIRGDQASHQRVHSTGDCDAIESSRKAAWAGVYIFEAWTWGRKSTLSRRRQMHSPRE